MFQFHANIYHKISSIFLYLFYFKNFRLFKRKSTLYVFIYILYVIYD